MKTSKAKVKRFLHLYDRFKAVVPMDDMVTIFIGALASTNYYKRAETNLMDKEQKIYYMAHSKKQRIHTQYTGKAPIFNWLEEI